MKDVEILIVIPARYGSIRLPKKPLIPISGKPMIQRVAEIAEHITLQNQNCNYVIATDHSEIESFAKKQSLPVILTSQHCNNGTERVAEVVNLLKVKPKLIINIQGDNPVCHPRIIQKIIDTWKKDKFADIYSPSVLLDWNSYFQMIEDKNKTPFSGTVVMVDKNNFALSFSKNIIPAIRNIDEARKKDPANSPVRLHIGIYAYTFEALMKYNLLEESLYEQSYVEGLEQYRFLYNNFKIKMIDINCENKICLGGVDSFEDIKIVENYINKCGELLLNID